MDRDQAVSDMLDWTEDFLRLWVECMQGHNRKSDMVNIIHQIKSFVNTYVDPEPDYILGDALRDYLESRINNSCFVLVFIYASIFGVARNTIMEQIAEINFPFLGTALDPEYKV